MQFVDAVAAGCASALDAFTATYSDQGQVAAEFTSPARQLLAGGKRARPRLADAAWRAFGGAPLDEAIVRAGTSLELFQAAALVHDDVVDAAQTRRGMPAAHRQFAAQHAARDWRGPATSYGDAGALLLGDLLLALSQREIEQSARRAPGGEAAREIYQEMTSEVAFGQFLDIRGAAAAQEPDVAAALAVVRHKSARYSVEHPLTLGAALAGASAGARAALAAFGLPLGEAFQLRDDELGVFGDPQVTGKPAGDDLAEGKRTVLVLLGLQLAPAGEAAFLRDSLGDRQLPAAAVERIRHILTASGAHQRHEELIAQRYRQALDALDAVPVDVAARGELADIAAALVARRS